MYVPGACPGATRPEDYKTSYPLTIDGLPVGRDRRVETSIARAYDGRVETRPDAGPSAGGYVMVLLGVAGFVLGCFLPYLGGSFFVAEGSLSLFRLVWTPVGGPFEHAGGVLSLFAGAATVGVIALLGIGRRRAWTPRALVAGAAAWTLTWIGVQMTQAVFGPKAVGYWVVLASMGVAIIGTVVVWTNARAHHREPTAGAPSIDSEGSTTREQPPDPPPPGPGTIESGV